MSYKNKSDAVKYNNEYNNAANANGESVNEFLLRLVRDEIENTKA